MHDFYLFLVKHWELSLAFCVIAGYWLFIEYLEWTDQWKIKPERLVHLMNVHKAHVIDLRERTAFEQGHILGAWSIPQKTLLTELPALKKKISKKSSVILVDQEGRHAKKSVPVFLNAGFQDVFYLEKGLQHWLKAGLPLEKLESKKSL